VNSSAVRAKWRMGGEGAGEAVGDSARRRGPRSKKEPILRRVREWYGSGAAAGVRRREWTVQWALSERDGPWLPCIVVPPTACKTLAQARLAKELVSAQRPTALVFWLGYHNLGKVLVDRLRPYTSSGLGPNFDELDCIGMSKLRPKTVNFVFNVKQEADLALENPRACLEGMLAVKPGDVTSLSAADETESTEARSLRSNIRRAFLGDLKDPFEPSWNDGLGEVFDVDAMLDERGKKGGRADEETNDGNDDDEEESFEHLESSGSEAEIDDTGDEDEYLPEGTSSSKSPTNKKRGRPPKEKVKSGKERPDGEPRKKKMKKEKKRDKKTKRSPEEVLDKGAKKLCMFLADPELAERTDARKKVLSILNKLSNVAMSQALLERTESTKRAAKLVGKLCKHSNEELRTKADEVRKAWLNSLKRHKK